MKVLLQIYAKLGRTGTAGFSKVVLVEPDVPSISDDNFIHILVCQMRLL
jgi:hypothetical protein